MNMHIKVPEYVYNILGVYGLYMRFCMFNVVYVQKRMLHTLARFYWT